MRITIILLKNFSILRRKIVLVVVMRKPRTPFLEPWIIYDTAVSSMPSTAITSVRFLLQLPSATVYINLKLRIKVKSTQCDIRIRATQLQLQLKLQLRWRRWRRRFAERSLDLSPLRHSHLHDRYTWLARINKQHNVLSLFYLHAPFLCLFPPLSLCFFL